MKLFYLFILFVFNLPVNCTINSPQLYVYFLLYLLLKLYLTLTYFLLQNTGNSDLLYARLPDLAPKWVRLAPNGKFSDQIQYILAHRAKIYWICSENFPDLSHLGPIWPTLGPNLVTVRLASEFMPLTVSPSVSKNRLLSIANFESDWLASSKFKARLCTRSNNIYPEHFLILDTQITGKHR